VRTALAGGIEPTSDATPSPVVTGLESIGATPATAIAPVDPWLVADTAAGSAVRYDATSPLPATPVVTVVPHAGISDEAASTPTSGGPELGVPEATALAAAPFASSATSGPAHRPASFPRHATPSPAGSPLSGHSAPLLLGVLVAGLALVAARRGGLVLEPTYCQSLRLLLITERPG
jgi:hypothetical protein